MRILWFTNVPLPQVAAAAGRGTAGFSGHWMSSLFEEIVRYPGIELGVATAFPRLPDLRFEKDGARFYAIEQAHRAPTFSGTRREIARCAEIVGDFRPDLIHIHGSERFFGLLKAERLTSTPAVVSLQGLLGPYSTFRNFFGALSLRDVVRSTRLAELALGLGLLHQYKDLRRAARQEARILASVEGVLGRTEWDAAWARAISPAVTYHHVGEVLRPQFSSVPWAVAACDRHTLIYTNAGHPRRGTENLLAATAALRSEFPGIRLRLAGVVSVRSGYGRFLRQRIRRLGLSDCVEFIGYLDADAMAAALRASHCFVISSYIENSPNSLGEAMMVGMPCIASYVGGIPSLVKDGQNGLLFPVDDVPMLAARIRSVFRSDDLARSLGAAARETARVRHGPDLVRDQLIAAYKDTLDSLRRTVPPAT